MFSWGHIFPRSIKLSRICLMSKALLSGPFRCCFTVASFVSKNPRANNGFSHHKSKQRCELEWARASFCLPPLFSLWVMMCDIVFLCGYIHCTNMLIGWNSRTRSQAFSCLLPQSYLPLWVATGQPWRDVLPPLHSYCPSMAQLNALHL